MDHAPDRDSSKRPAEERGVEGSASRGQLLDRAHAKVDVADVEPVLFVERVLDAGAIWVEGEDPPGGWRVREGDPAIAAADLEDTPAFQRGEALDQADLHPVGRIGADVEWRSHRSDASVD